MKPGPELPSDQFSGGTPAGCRPSAVTDAHLQFLDALRVIGVTNMFGATPYLIENFEVSRPDARTILTYWMETYGRGAR